MENQTLFLADTEALKQALVIGSLPCWETLGIYQDGKIILKGDKVSIQMIYQNITGKNEFETETEKENYMKWAEQQGFERNKEVILIGGQFGNEWGRANCL